MFLMAFNPVYSFFNTIKLILQRKIYFPKGCWVAQSPWGMDRRSPYFRK